MITFRRSGTIISKGTDHHWTHNREKGAPVSGRPGEDERMPRNDEFDTTFDIVNRAKVIMSNYALENQVDGFNRHLILPDGDRSFIFSISPYAASLLSRPPALL
jgi:hypothetical protein